MKYLLFITMLSLSYMFGQPTFEAHSLGTSDSILDFVPVDMDGDGDIDLVACKWVEGAVVWFENDGMENFTTHVISVDHNYVGDIDVIDLDQDGDLDVIIGSGGNGTYDHVVTWAENNGSQSFTIHIIGSNLNNSNAIQGSDLDQDGDIDILIGWRDGILWYENNGSESFTQRTVYSSSYGGFGDANIASIDMDQDGDMDIVCAHFSSFPNGSVAWYENHGSGSFSNHTIVSDLENIRSIYPMDLDGDGDIDVLSASQYDGKIAWHENNGSSDFTTHIIESNQYGARGVFAADMDGDNDIDIISASSGDSMLDAPPNINLYENNGSESFTTHTINQGSNKYGILAVDLDQDGDMDLLDNSYSSSWYENLGNPIYGCTGESSCNYNPDATVDDGSCIYPDENYDCYGNCLVEIDCAGECGGSAIVDECDVCGGDNVNCSDFTSECICIGCTEEDACNYNASATIDNDSCYYEGIYDCEGNCIADIDCAGTCGGDLELDCGGVCGGDNSTALSCCGLPFYDDCTTDCYEDSMGTCCIEEDTDYCGMCFGGNSSCMGDVNLDGALNVLDILILVNLIIYPNTSPTDAELALLDLFSDGILTVNDVIILVNMVLDDEPSLCDGLTEVELWGEWYDIGTTTAIDLYNQGLTGSILPEIGCLTNLTSLNLSYNELTGEIPIEIGNLTNLTNLSLRYNQLTGEIHPEIGNLTNLIHLFLHHNQLTGEIPSTIGNLTNLAQLLLDYNQLTGEIPSEIGNLTNLVYLELELNQLTGDIPSEIGNLTNLINLDLYGNQLTGSIPSEIGNLTNLTTLSLNENHLSGEIPAEIGSLTNLSHLWLHNNQLTGEIPSEIGNLTNLSHLWLYNNQLTGEIPQEVCDFIESNNINMWYILSGNNLINTCE